MHESTKKLINFVRLRIDEEEEQWRGGCNLKVHIYTQYTFSKPQYVTYIHI